MTSQIIPLLFVLLYLESVKRKGKNYKSLNISRAKRVFFDEIKNTFHIFGRAIIWWKNKNLIKKQTQAVRIGTTSETIVKRQVKDSLISKY